MSQSSEIFPQEFSQSAPNLNSMRRVKRKGSLDTALNVNLLLYI
jgi:hypothetical protein